MVVSLGPSYIALILIRGGAYLLLDGDLHLLLLFLLLSHLIAILINLLLLASFLPERRYEESTRAIPL
jgi:hypothetical protein